jgi:hypothetical protein
MQALTAFAGCSDPKADRLDAPVGLSIAEDASSLKGTDASVDVLGAMSALPQDSSHIYAKQSNPMRILTSIPLGLRSIIAS